MRNMGNRHKYLTLLPRSMNQIQQTMIEQMNVRQPCEPCGYVTLAKSITTIGETSIAMKVNGDRFKGSVMVTYNEGTDLYDVLFYNRKGEPQTYSDEGLDFEQLPGYLWRMTYIV